ncbi:MAG TPA: hypothetical protein VJ997_08140 [Longimicrobiales bacterium]|nr:hypothetical protein [Longimicrobiales bacterium]
MRRLRNLIQASIPIVGAIIIFLALILIPDGYAQARLGVVVFGILVLEAGVWKVANRFLPSERRYDDLRQEVDRFILLVRGLHRASLEARTSGSDQAWERVREVTDTMHDSVDRLAEMAGRSEDDELVIAPETDES